MQKHVFFDLDSTLATIEGLDYLAGKLGLADRLAEITRQAMNGEIPMREAMTRKLATLKPSHDTLTQLAKIYLDNLTPGAFSTVHKLQEQGYLTWIISGNFHPAAGIVAKHLGINEQRVLANRLQFNRAGEFLNFDSTQPLANNGGKALLIRAHTDPTDLIFMIGDGATDLETQGAVDLFIGFGGVIKRAKIAKNAEVYVENPDLRAVLPHILTYQRKILKN